MRKFIVLIAIICVMLSGTAYADGTPFEDVITWPAGQTVFEGSGFQYTHNIAFDPCAGDFCDVTLELTHKGNNSTQNELWYLNDGNDVFIGNLSQSAGFNYTDTFIIGSALYPSFPTPSWAFVVKVLESVQDGDKDNVVLFSSKLSGSYNCNPVPIPAAVWLLGSGLLGLIGIRRKFKR